MAAGDVVTKFVVEDAVDLEKALNDVTREFQDMGKFYKKSAREIAAASSSVWDEVYPERVSQRLTQAEKDLKKFGNSAKALQGNFPTFRAIGADIKNLVPNLGRLNGVFGKFTALVGTVSPKTYAWAAGLTAVGVAAGAATAAFMGLRKASDYFVGNMLKAIPAAHDFEKALSVMRTTFSDLNKEANETSFDGATDSMERFYKATLFTKTEILRAQAALGRTSKNVKVLEAATQAVLDVSAARPEMNTGSAAQWLTTILGDPSRTVDKFRRAEIQVTKEFEQAMRSLIEAGKMEEAQMRAIAQVTARYGGAATAVKNTIAGGFEIIEREKADIFREAAATFSKELLPATESFGRTLQNMRPILLDLMNTSTAWTKTFAEGLSDVSRVISDIVIKIDELDKKPSFEGETGLVNWEAANSREGRQEKVEAAVHRGMEESAVTGFTKFTVKYWGAMWDLMTGFDTPTVTPTQSEAGKEFANKKEADRLEEERQQKIRQSAEYAVGQVETWDERVTRFEKNREAAEKERATQQANFERSWKRVQVYFRDTENHWERYASQMAKIRDTWKQALNTGNATAGVHKQLMELQKRLYDKARESESSRLADIWKKAREAGKATPELFRRLTEMQDRLYPKGSAEKDPYSIAGTERARAEEERLKKAEDFERLMSSNDPLEQIKKLREAFKDILKGGAGDPRQRPALQNILGQMEALAGTEEEFVPSVTAAAGKSLYDALRAAALKPQDKVEKAVEKQTKFLQGVARTQTGLMAQTLAKLPPAAVAGGGP